MVPYSIRYVTVSARLAVLELRTGCRLHFGLMELAQGAPQRFAGLGVMLQQPCLQLRLHYWTSDCLDNSPPGMGPLNANWRGPAQRTTSATELHLDQVSLAAALELPNDSAVEYQQRIGQWLQQHSACSTLEIISAYPFHCGLGTGTQLASLLYAAAAVWDHREPLSESWQLLTDILPTLNAQSVARQTQRGRRSAIGLTGFLSGGLVLDGGFPKVVGQAAEGGEPECDRQLKVSSQRPVDAKYVAIPAQWRFVLIRPCSSSQITGQREQQLMNSLAHRPNSNRQVMWDLANSVCLAAQHDNYCDFVESLESYLRLASQLFAGIQQGPYNGPLAAEAAGLARSAGLRAVGQSSWGPTIFGVAANDQAAEEAAAAIRRCQPSWVIHVTAAAAHGAQVRR
ncbi:MAG: hypothetical protein KF752_14175 [Pirellulaceae bacterium]|nr:hypothetical protein [Pirellulaceae bacterium]